MRDHADAPERPFDIVVVGEVNPDVIVSDADPHPAFGQAERLVREIRIAIGSSSVITACGAARLGLRVAMVGAVGDDEFGRFMLDAMRERGLDVSAVRVVDDVPTGASVILSNGHDRAILTARGTIGALAVDDIPSGLLERARHIHIGSWFLQERLRPGAVGLLDAAHRAGLTASLDPNWDPAGVWDGGLRDALPSLDLVFPNESEVTRITGIDDVDAAAVALARLGRSSAEKGDRPGPLVVVKRGPAGALVASADGVVARVAAYPVDALDTTGAGDTFDAGFLVAWLGGSPPMDALRAGVVAGSLSTTSLGGTDGQPTRSALDAALRAWVT